MAKVYSDATSALAGLLKDDMVIMAGGFGLCGIPSVLIKAIRDSGVKNLTLISNNAGIDGEVNGEHGILRRGDLMEMAGFFERGNAGHPVMAYNFLAFLGPGCPEQIDGSGDASLGDAASFTNVGYTEKGDFFGSKNSGNIFEAMTVGSGFDNGHQGHVRPGLSGDAKIVT